ncbi:MAG TPA: dipicolinate synthase subunit B [Lachnospiraceae bacterium]|nr:dipicolinate synthase subunit B [Lachnospiraceae bacterium]
MQFSGINIGFAITGSFCTFDKIKKELQYLIELGANVIPIFSFHAATIDSRFGIAKEFVKEVEKITGNQAILTIEMAEPLGPKGMIDILIIAPCTGNTIAKLSNSITDTPVLMAAKAHLRNNKPLVISISTNDGLGLNLKNIGTLLCSKGVYFVPFGQDNCSAKPKSLVAHVDLMAETLEKALVGEQIQPILISF